jgi:glycosyltransferase involved in cell wall biosynthesis
MPLITVGVSTYNRREYLRESLDSLLAQTWTDYEIIVMDDGSTDSTDEMMGLHYPGIKYFYKENGGDASAKNAIAERADSRFLVFNDSDDLFYPNSLDMLVKPLLEHPAGHCSYGQYVRIDAQGRELETTQKVGHFPSGRILPDLLDHIIVSGCGFMYPLESFRRLGGFDTSMRVGHDYLFTLRMALDHHFHAMNAPVFKRRRHDGNLSGGSYDKIKLLADMVESFCREHAADAGLEPKRIARRLARYNVTLAREARRERRPRSLVQDHLRQSLQQDFQFKTLLRRLIW